MAARAAMRIVGLAIAAVSVAEAGVMRKANIGGPCGAQTATIYATTVADVLSRSQYSSSDTVLVYISANITAPQGLILGSNFSCTIILADPALAGGVPFVESADVRFPSLMVRNATNVIIRGIGIAHDTEPKGQPLCAWASLNLLNEIERTWSCPSLFVIRSFNVIITQVVVQGRTDVVGSGAVEISASYLVSDMHNAYAYNEALFKRGLGMSACTVRYIGCGDAATLTKSGNVLANNEIRGSHFGVCLYLGAVGVTVRNNLITEYDFAGIQCGAFMVNVADCMLNDFSNNYIKGVPGMDSDGTGTYYNIKWYNPGNRDSCNYVEGTPRGLYLDYVSSNLLVEGMVCINTGAGFKTNGGKRNVIKSMVLVNTQNKVYITGIVSCMNWCVNRCGWGPDPEQGYARQWINTFTTRYSNNSLWSTNWPHLRTWCTDTSVTFNNKTFQCNPEVPNVPGPAAGAPASFCYKYVRTTNIAKNTFSTPPADVTGNCSALPALNSFDFYYVSNLTFASKFWNQKAFQPQVQQCEPFGAFSTNVNYMPTPVKKYPLQALGFNDETGAFDFGADDPKAPIYALNPGFYSCPRSKVGVQSSAFARAYSLQRLKKAFGKRPPKWFFKPLPPVPQNQNILTRPSAL